MRELVFVHGRAQQGKDSVALKQLWVDTLKEGLAKSGLTLPIPEDKIRFPYYGDTLDDLVGGKSEDEAAAVVVRGDSADSTEKEFIRATLEEIRQRFRLDEDQVREAGGAAVKDRGPLNWEWVQGILKALDRHVPGASSASVALFTRDVYQYLENPGLRDVIDTGVREAFDPNVETVLVGHSLGTVVAYNVLRRDGQNWNVPLFVTLGSPLAITTIRRKLEPVKHPTAAKSWFNAMDERDVVALYPLDQNHFDVHPKIENKTDVDNQTDNRHGIVGYLNDEVVARRIHEALQA